MNQLNAKAFGLATAVLWAGYVSAMGLLAIVCSWAKPFVDVLAVMYRGYNASIVGSLIGIAWALVDGFIFGWLLAWLYNKFSK